MGLSQAASGATVSKNVQPDTSEGDTGPPAEGSQGQGHCSLCGRRDGARRGWGAGPQELLHLGTRGLGAREEGEAEGRREGLGSTGCRGQSGGLDSARWWGPGRPGKNLAALTLQTFNIRSGSTERRGGGRVLFFPNTSS